MSSFHILIIIPYFYIIHWAFVLELSSKNFQNFEERVNISLFFFFFLDEPAFVALSLPFSSGC